MNLLVIETASYSKNRKHEASKDEVMSCRHECFKDKGNLGVGAREGGIDCV